MKSRKNCAMTLLEAMVASSVTVFILGTVTSVWFASAASWVRGSGKIDAESQSGRAVRTMSSEIQEAMDVAIDANGQGITFHIPSRDANGDFMMDAVGQPVPENFNRRIYLDGTKVKYIEPSGTRVLAKDIITTDPLSTGGSQSYKIFVAGQGAITRQVTIQLVIQTKGAKNEKVNGRKREVVFLRNIYNTTR